MKQQAKAPLSWLKLEICPDFDKRFTLIDGRTKAIPYPRRGYNCKA